MCVAARVPLIESGTAGYLGQVQPIIKVNRNGSGPPNNEDLERSKGCHGMLRLRSETNPQKLPGLHNTLYTERTDPLCCMGEVVSVSVRSSPQISVGVFF